MQITNIDAYGVQIATTEKEFRSIFDNLMLFPIDPKESFSLDSPLNMVNFEISPQKIRIITGSQTAICIFEEKNERGANFIPYVIHVEASEFGKAIKKIAKNLNPVRVDIEKDYLNISHGSQQKIKIETKYTHPNGVEMFDMVMPKKFDFSYEIDVKNFMYEIELNPLINCSDANFLQIADRYKYVAIHYNEIALEIAQLTPIPENFLMDLEKIKKCLSPFKNRAIIRVKNEYPKTILIQSRSFSVLTMNDFNAEKSYTAAREAARIVYPRIEE